MKRILSFALVGHFAAGATLLTALSPLSAHARRTQTVSASRVASTPLPLQDKGSIQGIIFADGDGDGIQDTSEIGLTSRVVFLDLNGNKRPDDGEKITETDGTGAFRFENLPPGSYRVVEQMEATMGLTPTGGTGVRSVELTKSDETVRVNFGDRVQRPVKIEGVWIDTVRKQRWIFQFTLNYKGGQDFTGALKWMRVASLPSDPLHANDGRTGTESIQGIFDRSSCHLKFDGTNVSDPTFLGLDIYRAILSSDGRSVYGVSKSASDSGVWMGRILAYAPDGAARSATK